MMFKLPKRGPYRGRLAFDPDTGFHVDPVGRKVVTDDAGKTWRYAKRGDSSHQTRYQQRVVVVASTTDEGHAAGDPAHAHHLDTAAAGGLVAHPDAVAPVQTSHTEAYA